EPPAVKPVRAEGRSGASSSEESERVQGPCLLYGHRSPLEYGRRGGRRSGGGGGWSGRLSARTIPSRIHRDAQEPRPAQRVDGGGRRGGAGGPGESLAVEPRGALFPSKAPRALPVAEPAQRSLGAFHLGEGPQGDRGEPGDARRQASHRRLVPGRQSQLPRQA